MTANVRKLADERDNYLRDIANLQTKISAIQAKVDGLELAISVLQRDAEQPSKPSTLEDRLKRATKDILLQLLHEVRGTGLNASSAVDLALTHEIGLVRGSAASTLSRMKADGVVTYDGKVYRLPEYTPVMLQVHTGGKGS